MELLLGCGRDRARRMPSAASPTGWKQLITLDHEARHEPDVVHDLNDPALPFPDNHFDEIHAYEVLEHTGTQGDWRFFFAQFSDFWRVLKPGGLILATVPSHDSIWAWGDPSHTRVIPHTSLVFLHQPTYASDVGKTAMSDFRSHYTADFDILLSHIENGQFMFSLQAVKPSRIKL